MCDKGEGEEESEVILTDVIIYSYFYPAKKKKAQNALQGGGACDTLFWNLNVHLVFVPRVLFQDNATLKDVSVRDVLLCGQFRTFCRTQSYRRGVGLESRDRPWLSRLTNDLNSLSQPTQEG